MTVGEKALNVALSQLGVKEQPSGSNHVQYNSWYYGSEVYGVQFPWCMTFVMWVYNKAGYPLPYKTASCSMLLNWYRSNMLSAIVTTPRAGDIVIYNFGHTGIVQHNGVQTITAIEGNTSLTSDDNGGCVMRRTREKSVVTAYIRPYDGEVKEDTTINTVKGSTASETTMIKSIQGAIGALVDGEIGTQTMSDIACKLGAIDAPLTLEIYGIPVIIAKNIVPFEAKGATVTAYNNVISGSFLSGTKPCSILVQDSLVRQKYACHYPYYNKPESVIYRLRTGEFGIVRARTTDELPANVRWAVGGLGLLDNYAPVTEGFTALTYNGKTTDFSDVLRSTNHTMLGVKNGYCYLVYCKSMTGAQVNAFAKKLGLEMAIMLDGGHVAAMNGAESFAKINTSQKQYYMVQGTKAP